MLVVGVGGGVSSAAAWSSASPWAPGWTARPGTRPSAAGARAIGRGRGLRLGRGRWPVQGRRGLRERRRRPPGTGRCGRWRPAAAWSPAAAPPGWQGRASACPACSSSSTRSSGRRWAPTPSSTEVTRLVARRPARASVDEVFEGLDRSRRPSSASRRGDPAGQDRPPPLTACDGPFGGQKGRDGRSQPPKGPRKRRSGRSAASRPGLLISAAVLYRPRSSPPTRRTSCGGTSRTSTSPSSPWSTCRRWSRGRCSPATPAAPRACAGCSSTSSWASSTSPATSPIDATVGLQPGRGALRQGLPRVRRRLGGPAGRRPPGVRAGVEPADQGPRVGPAHGLPRAVDPLHRLRRPAPSGRYRYYRDPEILDSATWAPATSATWTGCSTPTPSSCPSCSSGSAARIPKDPATPTSSTASRSRPRRSTPLPRACCRRRPSPTSASTAPARRYEALLLRMRAHPLPEARAYADMMLTELRKVIPSFLKRVDLPDRGGAWSAYLETNRERDGARGRASCSATRSRRAAPDRDARRLRSRRRGQARRRHALSVHRPARGRRSQRRVERMSVDEQAGRRAGPTPASAPTVATSPGGRSSGRSYRFDVLSDYGAFRDLQRHRMLTIEWQPLTPRHGYVAARGGGRGGRGASASTRRWTGRAELYEAIEPAFGERRRPTPCRWRTASATRCR